MRGRGSASVTVAARGRVRRQDLTLTSRRRQTEDQVGCLEPVDEVIDGCIEVGDPLVLLLREHPVGHPPLEEAGPASLGPRGGLRDEQAIQRTEERRVGKEGVSTWRSRWSTTK